MRIPYWSRFSLPFAIMCWPTRGSSKPNSGKNRTNTGSGAFQIFRPLRCCRWRAARAALQGLDSRVAPPLCLKKIGNGSRIWLRRAGSRLPLSLIAAFSDVLASWSRSGRFTINLTLFQRWPVHPQVDRLVGDFTSITLLEVETRCGNDFLEHAVRLQKQLWTDLNYQYCSGVRVMRELMRTQKIGPRATMGVVFTSAIGAEIPGQEELNRLSGSDAALLYAVSQTPQVWLDHQVYEQGGRLHVSWDAVEELFPEGVLDDMFAAYVGLLEQLAEGTEAWKEKRRERLPEYQRALQAEAKPDRGGEAGRAVADGV